MLLGSDPPRLPALLLVRTAELFGISDGTTRTALSRMAAAGEVSARGTGRGTAYELSGAALLRRRQRQATSRLGVTDAWDGRWIQAVIGANGRRTASERAALRQSLSNARFAELREGVWLRPDNLGSPPGGDDSRGYAEWLDVVPRSNPTLLVARLWDLDRWGSVADRLRDDMTELVPALEVGDHRALAPGFVVSASVLRHLQADPLLPTDLLPDGWSGAALRSEYDRYDNAYRAVIEDWFREQR